MVYEDLVSQFENLSVNDKNSLLIYKSILGVAINALDNNNEKVEEIYNNYKEILDNPKNIFMKTIFKDIDFDNEIDFRESLEIVREKLLELTSSLVLNSDLTVYRMVSIPNNKSVFNISKDKFISTSIDINTCLKFLIPEDNYNHYLYQINLEKGSPISICPYGILYNKDTEQLKLSKTYEQKEIILNKDNFSFDCYSSSIMKLDNIDIEVKLFDAFVKEKNIKKNKIN